MIDFTKLEEGQTVLFDFEGKTYERKIKYGTANIPEVNKSDFYFNYGDLDIRSKIRKYVNSGDYNYNIWFIGIFKGDIENLNVRFKPEYNFHVGQKVSYVIDGEKCVGTVINAQSFPHDLIIYEDRLEEDIWLYHNELQKWDEAEIERYQVKPIIITDMETPIEPDFDQQIINAKLELGSWMVSRHAEMNLVGDKVRQTNNKIRLIEKQRKMYNAEQLWNRLRDQVVRNEDENDDEKFYDMIQDLELYYETKLKPITRKEFTSNDGC